MNKIIISSLLLMSSFAFVYADAYEGPYCYESKNETDKTSESSQARDDYNVRGTCKIIDFTKKISLDSSITDKYFFYFYSLDYLGMGSVYNIQATSSKSIDDIHFMGRVDGLDIFVGKYAPKDEYKNTEIQKLFKEKGLDLKDDNESLAFQNSYTSAININDIFYFEDKDSTGHKIESYSRAGYPISVVSITSPITKIVEYWTIKEAPSGKLFMEKSKTESYLDDGSMRADIYSGSSADSSSVALINSTSTNGQSAQSNQKSFLDRIVGFFKNLFK